jgi:hypothetical protein
VEVHHVVEVLLVEAHVPAVHVLVVLGAVGRVLEGTFVTVSGAPVVGK